MGRWIDFRRDYKTMYPWFMESVWFVFKQLYEKGFIYRGFKVIINEGISRDLNCFVWLIWRSCLIQWVVVHHCQISKLDKIIKMSMIQLFGFHFHYFKIPTSNLLLGQQHHGHYHRISLFVSILIQHTWKFLVSSRKIQLQRYRLLFFSLSRFFSR